MLLSDAIWFTSPKFSNDYTEEKMFGADNLKKFGFDWENYIVCFGGGTNDSHRERGESFSSTSDLLSMWRGYCPNGGASIEFFFDKSYNTFSLLHNDYETSKNFTIYHQTPLPVIYTEPAGVMELIKELEIIKVMFNGTDKYDDININDLIPYIKHDTFREERESRLVLSNKKRQISNCIRFKKISDGSLVPYIVAKFGDIDNNSSSCRFNPTTKSVKDYIYDDMNPQRGFPIIIPQGNNQAAVYSEVEQMVKKHNENHTVNRLSIICDGHLPILNITVSPHKDQAQIVEQLKLFCRNKYWLRNVEIKCSQIPYSPFLR